MIETLKSIFKYYIAYFIFTSILSFIIAYFFIAPYMGNDKALGLNNENTYILLKSAYAGTIRTASRFTSGHFAEVDSDS